MAWPAVWTAARGDADAGGLLGEIRDRSMTAQHWKQLRQRFGVEQLRRVIDPRRA
jgi:hypothetical protein